MREMKKGDLLPGGGVLSEEYIRKKDWRIWKTLSGSMLCVSSGLHGSWLDSGLVEPGVFLPFSEDDYVAEEDGFGLVSSSEAGPYPRTGQEALAVAEALRRTRGLFPDACLARSFFLPRLPYLLFCGGEADPDRDPWTLGRWVSGGMNIPFTDRSRILAWAPGMTETLYTQVLDLFGWSETAPEKIREAPRAEEAPRFLAEPRREARKEGAFELPGRPELEKFFRERIIDVIDREEAYRRMGIPFPGPTLLVGPPGCGKTYAVEKLSDYLGWPCFRVNSESIASSYIHETSRLISQLFRNAMEEAPAIVIMDEMEAYLSSRSQGSGWQSHLEETAEFLRILPQLAEKKVLLFGMTNLPDQIDPAIKRKGRFDNILEVGLPSGDEIVRLLEYLLKDVPKEADLDPGRIAARLKGRPISDIAFVAKEAGRLSVIRGKDRIDGEILLLALDELQEEIKKKESRRSIGFQ